MKKVYEVFITGYKTVNVAASSKEEAIDIAKDEVDDGDFEEIEFNINDEFPLKDVQKELILNR